MNNTQKVLKNQHICEQATPNLGITQLLRPSCFVQK